MMRISAARPILFAIMLMTMPTVTAWAEYRDPLDSPAAISPMAASTQLQAITQAGDRLVAVGWRGHIVYSDDAGASWRQAAVPVDIDLTAVSFPTPLNGWAVGHGGVILNSVDGGMTWNKQLDGRESAHLMLDYYETRLRQGDEEAQYFIDEVKLNTEGGPEQPWLDVAFKDDMHGYVVGTFNQIMYTHDGGKSWVPQLHLLDNPNALHLNDIAYYKDALYIASERGTVFIKRPGSERFSTVQSGYSGSFFGVLANDQAVLAFGLKGTIYRSEDQGSTWDIVESGVSTALTGGALLPSGQILLVTQSGQVIEASAPTAPFKIIDMRRLPMLTDVVQLQPGKLVTVGMGGANLESVAP